MQYCFYFIVIHKILQDIKSNNRLFGDLPMIIERDFAQILIFIYQSIKAIIITVYIQHFYIWS